MIRVLVQTRNKLDNLLQWTRKIQYVAVVLWKFLDIGTVIWIRTVYTVTGDFNNWRLQQIWHIKRGLVFIKVCLLFLLKKNIWKQLLCWFYYSYSVGRILSDMLCISQAFTFSTGFGGLYKGFWLSAFQLVSGIFYITTYENVRHLLQQRGVQDSRIRALVGGGCASLVGQTIIVPFDVLSQHMMVLGQLQGRGKSKVVVNPLRIDYRGKKKGKVWFGCLFLYYFTPFVILWGSDSSKEKRDLPFHLHFLFITLLPSTYPMPTLPVPWLPVHTGCENLMDWVDGWPAHSIHSSPPYMAIHTQFHLLDIFRYPIHPPPMLSTPSYTWYTRFKTFMYILYLHYSICIIWSNLFQNALFHFSPSPRWWLNQRS